MSTLPPELADLNIIHPNEYASRGYPHDVWTWMRNNDPVFRWEQPEGAGAPFWAITKHADITEISKQPERFLSAPRLTLSHMPDPPADRRGAFPPTLISMDNPQHRVYRNLISDRFRPHALRKWHPEIERIGKDIVDKLIEDSSSGECDFVREVSAPLPIAVIGWLLGLPEADWPKLFDWTNRIIGAGDEEYQIEGVNPNEGAQATMLEVFQYFSALVEEKRKNPEDDLVTLFTQMEVDGEKLPLMDIMAWCLIIVIAGNETTRNGTSGGMLAFIEHQDQLRALQKNPSLLKPAVEEVVRWTTPVIHFSRTATDDYPLRDKLIGKGDAVGLFYASANRDEEVFEDPFTFRIDRHPNRHLGFGVGEHFCLGSHLARLEISVAYKHLLPRIEEIELSGPVERLQSSLVGGIKHLPIRYKIRAG
jgi:cholest-4-en-3-one 26-monooxygenase